MTSPTAMVASLPPLANVVAFRSADPARVARVRAQLESAWPDVVVVGGWLLATRPLPRSRPVPAECRDVGLAFTEGAEQVAGAPGGIAQMVAILRERRVDRLTAIPGDFGLLWLGDQELVAVRSAAGRVPLYWWSEAGDIAVGTLLTDVAQLKPVTLRLDPLVAALWAGGQAMFYERRTPVAGVWAAHPGEVVRVDIAGTPTIERWFDPWPEDLPPSRRGDFDAKAAGFGAAVRATVAAELAPDGGNLLSLSGGVDSSSLAFLARDAHRPLAALSFVPTADSPARAHELGFIDPIVEALAIAPHWVRELCAANRLAWLAGLPDVSMPVLHPVLCVLGEIVEQEEISVLVGGEFCDELCGGEFAIADWIRTAGVVDVVRRVVRGQRSGVRSWLRHRTGRLAPSGPHRALRPIVADDMRAGFDTWRSERNHLLAVSAKVHAHTIEQLAANDGAVAQNWEVCSAHGVRRTFPFLSRAVIEAVAGCRPAELVSPTLKSLSRTAFRGQVPDRWLDRADVGSFGTEPPALFEAPELPADLDQVLRSEVLERTEHRFDLLNSLMLQELVRFVTNLNTVSVWGAAGGPR